jgi:FkbH-like protein
MVLALDLDNTLWGGVLGEVGGHGVTLGGLYPGNCYTRLQRAALRLREQGVILVLASKNDPDPVAEALSGHPEVLLRPESFSVSAVNRSSKAENLRQAADSLGLSTSAMVFMDDSAFERGHIAEVLPEIGLVAADGDPAHLERALLRPGWFDVMELTDTDLQRPELYRSRAMRSDFSGGFGSSQDYLRALDIQVVAELAGGYSVPRVAQLAARTNQFNLTGLRYDETATAAMSADPGHLVAAFSVSDRFGDEGIVGAAWVECGERVWRVLNLVLSCRVLGRGVELAVVEWLAARASAAGATTLHGRFVPSQKNAVAASFWEQAGFAATGEDGVFELDISEHPYHAPEWIRLLERSAV